ncbi:serum response factor-binding protein 1 isoform 2-T2 [Mantella aurantiaca]
MRKDVKKVKVLTIRKLTRNISKLKSKKGTEELIQKNQRRAQRLLEEIHTIKKLRPDDVTKTALQKEINFEKVCKKPNSTVETRAIARLATHSLLKQKISTIKDAIKAFKEARKIAVEQEDKTEETSKPDESTQIMRTDTEKKCEQKKTKKNHKAENTNTEVTKAEDKSLGNPTCKTLNTEADLVASNRRTAENIPGSQNGQKTTSLLAETKLLESVPEKPASLTAPKVSSERKLVVGIPEKPSSPTVTKVSSERKPMVGIPEKPSSPTVPEVSSEGKLVVVIPEKPSPLTVPKVSPERKPMVGIPEKPSSPTVPKVSSEKKPVVGIQDKQAVENKVENKSRLGKKTPVHESASDSSDIEDSDKEDKEYFDDSTEERFYKQSSGFEDSDSDSEDDFFLGKVRQTKRKKSSKNPEDKVEKEKLPTEATKPSAGSMEGRKGNTAPKTVKLDSVFCNSLSNIKQKSSFMKRETKLPPVKNMKAVVPQAPKWAKKPQAARNSTVKSQRKPETALHPSWEASRKRKEQSQIAVFQGKKIVFDD